MDTTPPPRPPREADPDRAVDAPDVARREVRLVSRLSLGAGLAALVALPFILLMLLVQSESEELERVDRHVADGLNEWARAEPAVVDGLEVIGEVTTPWYLRIIVVIIAVVLWRASARRLATWAVVTMAIGGALGIGLKVLIERARPSFPEPVATASSYSFPSGHALNSMLFAGIVLLIVLPLIHGAARVGAWALAAVLVLITAFDRVALGVHYLSDVAGGWIVALATLVGTSTAFGAWRGAGRPSEGLDPAGSRRASEQVASGQAGPDT